MSPALRCQAKFHPLRDTNAFLLGNCGYDGDDSLAEGAAGVDLLLCETAIADAIAGQPLKMLHCWQNAFPAEPVERPKQENVKLPLAGIAEHLLKLCPVRILAGFMVDVFEDNRPSVAG